MFIQNISAYLKKNMCHKEHIYFLNVLFVLIHKLLYDEVCSKQPGKYVQSLLLVYFGVLASLHLCTF